MTYDGIYIYLEIGQYKAPPSDTGELKMQPYTKLVKVIKIKYTSQENSGFSFETFP